MAKLHQGSSLHGQYLLSLLHSVYIHFVYFVVFKNTLISL